MASSWRFTTASTSIGPSWASARAVTIEQGVDQVQVARPATAGADRELTGQMRLGARRECGNLLMSDMQPLDLAFPANRVGKAVQIIVDSSIKPLYCGRP